jgi:hypothetical protein
VHGHAAALKQLWLLTWREAQTQTFTDSLLVIAACVVVATLMVPLMMPIDASIASTDRSPCHRHSFIEHHYIGARLPVSDDRSITGQKSEMLGARLGNQHPVKRIAMPVLRGD